MDEQKKTERARSRADALETMAEEIELHASRLYEATNADDSYDAKVDLDLALVTLKDWRASIAADPVRTDSDRMRALAMMHEIRYREVGGIQTVRGFEEDCSAEWWEASDGEAMFTGDTLESLADAILDADEAQAAAIKDADRVDLDSGTHRAVLTNSLLRPDAPAGPNV